MQMPLEIKYKQMKELLCKIGFHKKGTYINRRPVNSVMMEAEIKFCKRCKKTLV